PPVRGSRSVRAPSGPRNARRGWKWWRSLELQEANLVDDLHSGPRHRDGLQQPVHQRIARDPFRLRVEVGQHAVAKHGMRERADVFKAHVIAAVRQRARLGAEDEELRSADAGTEGDPLTNRLGTGRRL